MPTSDTQYKLGFVSTIQLQDNTLIQNEINSSGVLGTPVCVTNTLDLKSDNNYGPPICVTNTLELRSLHVYGTSICLARTLGLPSVNVYGTPISVSGNFPITLPAVDIIYFGEEGRIQADKVNIDTVLKTSIESSGVIASGMGREIGIAMSGVLSQIRSGAVLVNTSGIELSLPSGAEYGTVFDLLKQSSGNFTVEVIDASSRIKFSSGNFVTKLALDGLYSNVELIYDGTNWIATKENGLSIIGSGVL